MAQIKTLRQKKFDIYDENDIKVRNANTEGHIYIDYTKVCDQV